MSAVHTIKTSAVLKTVITAAAAAADQVLGDDQRAGIHLRPRLQERHLRTGREGRQDRTVQVRCLASTTTARMHA
jgi:hypothetical protein